MSDQEALTMLEHAFNHLFHARVWDAESVPQSEAMFTLAEKMVELDPRPTDWVRFEV